MGQRGRTSSAALSVVAGTDIDGRPQAPSDLTEFQRGVWDRTVANEAADVFRTAALQQLLKEYCRHVETADRLSKQVDRATGEGSNLSYQDIDCLLGCATGKRKRWRTRRRSYGSPIRADILLALQVRRRRRHPSANLGKPPADQGRTQYPMD
jgi:hypothetical protein